MEFWSVVGWIMLPCAVTILWRAGFHFVGKNVHPLSLTILFQIFALTLPGVIGIALLGWPMSYDTQLDITEITRQHVLYATFISVSILFIGIATAYRSGGIPTVSYRFVDRRRQLAWLSVASLICVAIKLATVSKIPLLLALQGDLVGAAEAKTRILTQQEGVTLFGLNYIVRSLPFVSFFAAYLAWLYGNKTDRILWLLFLSNIVIGGVNALYDIQKFQIVLVIACCFWLLHVKTGRTGILFGAAATAIVSAIMFFSIALGVGGQDAVEGALSRMFTGQSEGLFYIFQYIRPTGDYAWLGIPLGSVFSLPQRDPAAEVIPIVFPGADDNWINSNTYLIAHAWAIMGDSAIVLAPLFILANLILVSLMMNRSIRRDPALYYPLYFWMIVRLPIINVFTEFLWFKVALDFAINMMAIWFISQIPIRQPKKSGDNKKANNRLVTSTPEVGK